MISKTTATLLVSFAWLLCCTAQVTVKKGAVNLRLDGISGNEGPQVTSLLQLHLSRSGVVNLTPTGEDGVITGNASGGTLIGRLLDSNGREYVSRTYTGDWRDNANRFADLIVETLTGQKGIATTRIAFISKRTGQKELYIMDISGQRVVQLTRDNTLCGSPAIDHAGQRIAYTSYRSGFPDIYVVDLQTYRRRRIAEFPGINSGAAWAPNGLQLAATLSFEGNPEIYVLPAAGGTPQRITRAHGTDSSPTWSPDAREIIYVNDDPGSPRLMRIVLAEGKAMALRTGQPYATEPDWSPDGKRIAFNAKVAGRNHIFVMELDSGEVRQLTSGNSDFEDPSWTRNSRHLVCASNGTLLLLDAISGQSYVINNEISQCSEPSCSR